MQKTYAGLLFYRRIISGSLDFRDQVIQRSAQTLFINRPMKIIGSSNLHSAECRTIVRIGRHQVHFGDFGKFSPADNPERFVLVAFVAGFNFHNRDFRRTV